MLAGVAVVDTKNETVVAGALLADAFGWGPLAGAEVEAGLTKKEGAEVVGFAWVLATKKLLAVVAGGVTKKEDGFVVAEVVG